MKPGTVIAGKYQLIEKTDENERLTVFRAQTMNGEDRALKILNPWLLKDEKQIDRIISEVQNTASLKHENLARVFDVDFTDNVFYIALEWIDGVKLTDFIDQKKQLTPLQILRVVKKMAYLLEFAQRQNLAYRSIKLSNVMITPDCNVKVLAFNQPRSFRLVNGEKLEKTGADSDVFFLGVLLYTLIEKKYPMKKRDFVITDIRLIKYLELDTDWKLTSDELQGEIKRLLEEIIWKCVTMVTTDRIPGFYEFYDLLEKAVSEIESGAKKNTAAELMDIMLPVQSEKRCEPVHVDRSGYWVYGLLAVSLLLLIYSMI